MKKSGSHRRKTLRRKRTWKDYNREMRMKHDTLILTPGEDTQIRTNTAKEMNL